jgi:hypothetical protein
MGYICDIEYPASSTSPVILSTMHCLAIVETMTYLHHVWTTEGTTLYSWHQQEIIVFYTASRPSASYLLATWGSST